MLRYDMRRLYQTMLCYVNMHKFCPNDIKKVFISE